MTRGLEDQRIPDDRRCGDRQNGPNGDLDRVADREGQEAPLQALRLDGLCLRAPPRRSVGDEITIGSGSKNFTQGWLSRLDGERRMA
jgi:hypothetical protein